MTSCLKQCLDVGPALEGIQVSLLRLIACWTESCQTVARALLRSPSSFFFVELIISTGAKSPEPSTSVKALAALVVGLCFDNWGDDIDDSSGLGRAEIQAMIENRVGLTAFTSTLENLERVLQPG